LSAAGRSRGVFHHQPISCRALHRRRTGARPTRDAVASRHPPRGGCLTSLWGSVFSCLTGGRRVNDGTTGSAVFLSFTLTAMEALMRKFLAALVVFTVLVGPGFAAADTDASTSSALGASADVAIEAKLGKKGAIGAGVRIGKDLVLTAHHVVDDATRILVTLDRDGRPAETFDAEVIKTDENNDLALLRIKGDLPSDMKQAKLACRTPAIGETIEVVGSPLGVQFVHTWGRVAGVPRSIPPDGKGTVVPIDASIASGNSGGPVYDSSGKVIGIAEAVISADGNGEGHVNLMTPVSVICKEASN
jgi:S1-C subfamily serine protease